MGEPISNPDWRRSIETELQPLGVAAAGAAASNLPIQLWLFRLLADAEIAENDVEEIFDIDGTGDAPEIAQGETEVFSAQFR
jgi:hypothetical protein